MTFDEWYATQKHQLSNEQVCRVIWEAAAKAENEACAKVLQDNADACGEESIMRHILESQILAIRARRNRAAPSA